MNCRDSYPHSKTKKNKTEKYRLPTNQRETSPGIPTWLVWLGSSYQISLPRSNQYFKLLVEQLGKSVCVPIVCSPFRLQCYDWYTRFYPPSLIPTLILVGEASSLPLITRLHRRSMADR